MNIATRSIRKCVLSVAGGEEQKRYEDVVIATRAYRRATAPQDRILDGVNLVQAFRAWMDAWCPIDLSKNLVTVTQIYKIMDDLWQDVPEGE